MTRLLDWTVKNPLLAGLAVAGTAVLVYGAYKLLAPAGAPKKPGGWVARVMSEAEQLLALDTRTCVVQSGDTLGMIADKLGTTVAALMGANPFIADPDLIDVGWKLDIPG